MVGFRSIVRTLVAATVLVDGIAAASVKRRATQPTVDLGYAVHQATVNDTGYGYYNFSNIRYGSAPTGNKRFLASTLPSGTNKTINDGQTAVICPQANPLWELQGEAFVKDYLTGAPLANITNDTNAAALNLTGLAPDALAALIPKPDPRTSEDCLFLDVIVPKSIFDNKNSIKRADSGAAVLVWIYGGGFVGGQKAGSNPATLISRSQDDGNDGVIYVALNYRLGLYGWLSGPTFQASGTSNAGLHDQELALLWLKAKIHLFGGSASRITLIGESAGGSSIMHQITAYGGLKGPVPFQQAILQSPGFLPLPSAEEQEKTYLTTLFYASALTNTSVASVDDLRALSEDDLFKINAATIALSPYSSFTFGPTVDGNFVPQLPGQLLLHGQFDSSLTIMLGHNSNEGLFFTDPLVQNETSFEEHFTETQPGVSQYALDYISQVLYPPIFNDSATWGYSDYIGRSALVTSDISFVCNTRYLDTAFQNKTYSYYFAVPPGLHGQDVAFTFFDGDTTSSDGGSPVNATSATVLQRYLTEFAMTGKPEGEGVPFFPVYGANSSTQVLNSTGWGMQITDTAATDRCDWFQKGLYY